MRAAFTTEGEEIWPKRYARFGERSLPRQSQDRLLTALWTQKRLSRFLPPMFKPYQAETLEALAPLLGLDPGTFVNTVTEYNRAAAGNTELRMERLDGNCTRGITPPKSNWALPINRPPFYGLPLRPGITFTYMGVTVDERAHVVDQSGHAFQNVFAAGEIMSGNILTKGYLGGFGLTIGSVFGRLAGREAAANARA